MSEFSQIDDELLSAYLDDELTAEERARVEERLAADPASRQLLDELRSVSQAMKGLPTASLGADLRDSVLRRAERAMLVAKESGASRPSEGAFHMPFGRSKRAWIWAGMTLAAGLMLMFIERRGDQNAGLPKEVAMKQPAAAATQEPTGPLMVRALEAPAEERPTAGQPVPPLAEAARNEVAMGTPVSGGVAVSSDANEPRSPSVSTDGVVRYGGGAGGRGGSLEGRAQGRAVAQQELLVVHVSVTPEAMRNRAFDATLLNNQIQVEQDARELSRPSAPEDVEVVVVEAAPSQVYSTLADIKADTKNYVGIAVEQQAPLAANLAKKTQAADVQQFNRGRVANQQQVQLDPQLRNYYFAPDQDMYFRSRQLGELDVERKDQLGAASDQLADDSQSGATPSPAPQTLALGRNQSQSTLSAGSASAPAQASEKLMFSQGESLSRASQNVARRAAQKLAEDADRWQVLFVLQADEMAAPPSAAAPTAAEPVEQGLKNDE